MRTRRVTVNLPEKLLQDAMSVTGKGITDTLVEGLEQLRARRFFERAINLQGKIELDVDLNRMRARGHQEP